MRGVGSSQPPDVGLWNRGEERSFRTLTAAVSKRAEQIEPILVSLFERAIVGLGATCSSLDGEAVERMPSNISHVSEALDVVGRDDLAEEWQTCLRQHQQTANISSGRNIDVERGRKVLPVLVHILGVDDRDDGSGRGPGITLASTGGGLL